MQTKNVTRADLLELLNVSEKTLRNKISGTTDFTWSEAKKIRNTFFPDQDYDKLFEQLPKQ
ncbi:XRE family transcriptional regulator [Aminipila terrae]|uniref:XRE family transcriptional regulator n=1 Tax=Aminipila terrae TaxID=2697030 RepID=A0A6P1MDZ3_9FIRM|nr:XRE family transcriptional regulator [Aminipila terrae]QHI72870.1 XRE family transcriptional regulator [Aminipila terrae]